VSDTNEIQTEPTLLTLDGWHRAHGGRMVPFAGYSMPVQYEGIVAEHLWTRAHAGLFDVSHMGQIILSGAGFVEAAEAIVGIDIAGMAIGQSRYGLLLNEAGGILDDLIVTRWADSLFIVVNGAVKHEDIAHIRAHLPAGIKLDHLEQQGLLALQGPQAAAVLARQVTGEDKPDALGFMTGGRFNLSGVDAWISRSGYTGEDGFEISVPADALEDIADLLTAADEVKPIGLGARDSLRLEAGLPLYGHDLTPQSSAIGAGLGFAFGKRRRTDGGFIGAQAVQRDLADGAAQRRVGLSIEGRLPAREGATILAEGQPVGVVTSGGFSPSLERPIAMGWVDAAHAAPGTPLEIEVRGKRLVAATAPMPFITHNYVRKGK
jgi:aminomethyltransferase